MKHALLRSLASVLCAGFLGGCLSMEVQNPPGRHTCWCPTDAIASFGQDVYFGRFTPCFSDGHAVPITLPEHCDYSTGYSTSTASASASVSTSTGASASVSGSVAHD